MQFYQKLQKIQNLPLFLSIDRLENSQQIQLAPLQNKLCQW